MQVVERDQRDLAGALGIHGGGRRRANVVEQELRREAEN